MVSLLELATAVNLRGRRITSQEVYERRVYSGLARKPYDITLSRGGYSDCDCSDCSECNCDCSQGGDCDCTSAECEN